MSTNENAEPARNLRPKIKGLKREPVFTEQECESMRKQRAARYAARLERHREAIKISSQATPLPRSSKRQRVKARKALQTEKHRLSEVNKALENSDQATPLPCPSKRQRVKARKAMKIEQHQPGEINKMTKIETCQPVGAVKMRKTERRQRRAFESAIQTAQASTGIVTEWEQQVQKHFEQQTSSEEGTKHDDFERHGRLLSAVSNGRAMGRQKDLLRLPSASDDEQEPPSDALRRMRIQ